MLDSPCTPKALRIPLTERDGQMSVHSAVRNRATARHKIVVVGGGSAGLTVAARLKRQGQTDVAVIDPASTHYYQPLWTLVGGGCVPIEASARAQSKVMPKGVSWIRQAAVGVDPDTKESRSTTARRSVTTTW